MLILRVCCLTYVHRRPRRCNAAAVVHCELPQVTGNSGGNSHMDLKLSGLTALVTGASRGIGRAVAHELANEGCHLHLASRSAADLDKVRGEIAQKHKVKVECHPLDLGESRNIATLVERVGIVDILVNNA